MRWTNNHVKCIEWGYNICLDWTKWIYLKPSESYHSKCYTIGQWNVYLELYHTKLQRYSYYLGCC